jgi:hypothetical protein
MAEDSLAVVILPSLKSGNPRISPFHQDSLPLENNPATYEYCIGIGELLLSTFYEIGQYWLCRADTVNKGYLKPPKIDDSRRYEKAAFLPIPIYKSQPGRSTIIGHTL